MTASDAPGGPARAFGVIGDLHGRSDRLEAVLEVLAGEPLDAVLLVGDLVSVAWEREHRGMPSERETYIAEVSSVLGRAGELGVPVAWVPGNHDLPGVEVPGDAAIQLDRRSATIAGTRIYGIGGAGPARFGFPYEWSEEEIEALDVPEVDILLAHAPPLGSGLDLTMSARAVGSAAVRAHCRRARALACGHIHEAAGTTVLESCLCLNAGGLGAPYDRPQVGWLKLDNDGVRAEHLDLLTGRRHVESLP